MKPLVTITKIIAFYCLFYAGVKIFGILKGMWLIPNLIIALGLLIIGGVGFLAIKRNSYNWWYAIIGAVLISVLRYYETEFIQYMNQVFAS